MGAPRLSTRDHSMNAVDEGTAKCESSEYDTKWPVRYIKVLLRNKLQKWSPRWHFTSVFQTAWISQCNRRSSQGQTLPFGDGCFPTASHLDELINGWLTDEIWIRDQLSAHGRSLVTITHEPSQRYCKNEACLYLNNCNKENDADDLRKVLVTCSLSFYIK